MIKYLLTAVNKAELTKYAVLCRYAKRKEIFSKEDHKNLQNLQKKSSIFIISSLAGTCAFVYLLPLPLSIYPNLGVKIVLIRFMHRAISYNSKLNYFENLKNYCKAYELEEKMDSFDFDEFETRYLSYAEKLTRK